ncbi:carboxyl-terminal-processing peptidase 2, chloroplastic, partial [Tanacetum coccineum]
LDKGVIVYICDSRGVRDIYDTDGTNAIAASEPLAVLVNKGTASASEILAGALKDNKRAVLLGEPTFGKGKIQSVFQMSDGSGLAVTVARYETPDHIDINKVLYLSTSLYTQTIGNMYYRERPKPSNFENIS